PITGTCTRLTISGTARAASSLFTVTRTSSLPAAWSACTWATVPATSAVSVLVMDWTTMGRSLPTLTPPTSTVTVFRRFGALMMEATIPRGPKGPALVGARRMRHNRRPDALAAIPIRGAAHAHRCYPAGFEEAHRRDARSFRLAHRRSGHDRQVRGGDGRSSVDPCGRGAREEGDAGWQDHRPRLSHALAPAAADAAAPEGGEAHARHQLWLQQDPVHQYGARGLAHPTQADHQERRGRRGQRRPRHFGDGDRSGGEGPPGPRRRGDGPPVRVTLGGGLRPPSEPPPKCRIARAEPALEAEHSAASVGEL